jgi:hypothetical protein
MSVTTLEPWVPLTDFAKHLGCSERWLKYRVAEGMPSALIAGRRKVMVSEATSWLEGEGHIVKSV